MKSSKVSIVQETVCNYIGTVRSEGVPLVRFVEDTEGQMALSIPLPSRPPESLNLRAVQHLAVPCPHGAFPG